MQKTVEDYGVRMASIEREVPKIEACHSAIATFRRDWEQEERERRERESQDRTRAEDNRRADRRQFGLTALAIFGTIVIAFITTGGPT